MNKRDLIERVTEDCANQVDTGRGPQSATLNMASVGHVLATALPVLSQGLMQALHDDPVGRDVLSKNPILPEARAFRRILRRTIIGRDATKDQFKKPGRR